MRVLWISCLLIGSITCVPVGKDYRSNYAGTSFMQPPVSYGHMFSGEGMSSSPGSSSSLPSLSSPSFGNVAQLPAPQNVLSNAGPGSSLDVSSGNTNMAARVHYPLGPYAASESSGYGDSAPGGSYGGGYGSSASGYAGDSYYGYVSPQDEGSNSGSAIGNGAGDENPEPVFSDVSDLEPVYYYSARSSYQQGRSTFAQTRYTPGEEPVPPFPVSRRSSKATLMPNAPTKGGF